MLSICEMLHFMLHSVFSGKMKTPETPILKAFLRLLPAGDERIELPPKVLETPIIPFDQSPVSVLSNDSILISQLSLLCQCYSAVCQICLDTLA